jgi:hypothetical protein
VPAPSRRTQPIGLRHQFPLPRSILVFSLFICVFFASFTYAGPCGAPSLGAVTLTPNGSGAVVLSVDYTFPGPDLYNYLKVYIDGESTTYWPGDRATNASGTLTDILTTTCLRESGAHSIEVKAVSCARSEPQYSTSSFGTLNVETKPDVRGLTFTPDQTGSGSVSVDYTFPNSSSDRRLLDLLVDGVRVDRYHNPPLTGTWTPGSARPAGATARTRSKSWPPCVNGSPTAITPTGNRGRSPSTRNPTSP